MSESIPDPVTGAVATASRAPRMKLGIVDHVVSAGGVQRFVEGLIGGLLRIAEAKEWEVILYLAETNSAGHPVRWPPHLTGPGLTVRFLPPAASPVEPVDAFERAIVRLNEGRRWMRVPGTGRAGRALARRLLSLAGRWPRPRSRDRAVALARTIAEERFDVVYFPYPYLIPPPDAGVPTAVTMHDFYYKRWPDLGPILTRRLESETPRWLEAADRVVVSSRFTKSELGHFYPGFEAKTVLVHPGIPQSDRRPSAAAVGDYRRKEGLPERFLLTTGWIVPHKNQGVAFEAVAELRRRGRGLPLVCVGPNAADLLDETGEANPMVRSIRETCRSEGLVLGEDYFVLGHVSDFELECLYALTSAVVITALYGAGSFSSVEAMVASRPVILSDIPSHREHIDIAGGNAWLFDGTSARSLADAVDSVMGDPDGARERAVAAAREVRRVHSWDEAARRYLGVFADAARTRPATGRAPA